MEETRFQGSLSGLPFARLISLLWQEEKSGSLKIRKDNQEKTLFIDKGQMAVERSSFAEREFLQFLVKKNLLDQPSPESCEKAAAQNSSPLTKMLLELDLFSPSRMWKLMEIFQKRDIFPVFDWPEGEYMFDAENLPQKSDILFFIQTPGFILQGVRRMKNYDLIRAHLPAQNSALRIFHSRSLNEVGLGPEEKYILRLIENKTELETLYETSQLGKKETQKVIFALSSLGIIGFAEQNETKAVSSKPSQAEMKKILEAFDAKCSYIHKYISKELGPLALNVLEKCQEEIKPSLSPSFQKAELRADGRLDTRSILKSDLNHLAENERAILVRDMNEILAAEILAVKKTLGNEHERALVKNLEKIGEVE